MFSLFCFQTKILLSILIKVAIKTSFRAELACEILHYSIVPVLTAKLVVTIRTDNLNFTCTNSHYGNVESTTTKVINQDSLFALLFSTAIIKSCSCRLTNNLDYIKTCDFTCVLCCSTFCSTKVSRTSNNYVFYFRVNQLRSIFSKFTKNISRYFFRGFIFTIIVDRKIALTHKSFYKSNGVLRINNCIFLCNLTNYYLRRTCKVYHRRSCVSSFLIVYYGSTTGFVNISDTRICSTKVNTKDIFSHFQLPHYSHFLLRVFRKNIL